MTYSLTPKYYTNMDTRKHTNQVSERHFNKSVFSGEIKMKSFNKLVKTLAISTLGLGIATASISEAKAASLVPQTEGEIKTNLGCLPGINCIDTTTLPFGYAVTSLDYDFDNKGPKFEKSRLFADDRNTTNSELQAFGITFKGEDEGTNPLIGQTWFRPVANVLDKNGKLVPFENGRLEVGRFKFDFLGKTANEVRLDFFDVEDKNFTGIIEVNGVALTGQALANMLLPSGPNSNIQTLVLKDVKDFVVQLGKPGPNSVFGKTGDGVDLTVSVPESETTVGLGILAVAGVLTLKRRKGTSQKA